MTLQGMALKRNTNQGCAEGNDDVQRSIELLDRVLSEFDDVENANQIQNQQMLRFASSLNSDQASLTKTPGHVSSSLDDESPSLGHQSEDDGYMSMNGRKPKFAIAFKPVTEEISITQFQIKTDDRDVFPPPPEEAERLIATFLPTGSSAKTVNLIETKEFPLTYFQSETIPPPLKFQNSIFSGSPKHTATQTTLPKTRHQRPYGWENNESNFQSSPLSLGICYGSLPYQHGAALMSSPIKVPPRTVATAVERHREVRRRGSDDNVSSDLEQPVLRHFRKLANDEHFSDDSLEEILPPPTTNKRNSIAWEVLLDNDSLLAPGSTKVVGRRRKKSGSNSSTSSIPNVIKDFDEWPNPPPSTEEEIVSPFSDSDDHIILPAELQSCNLNGSGTYIIRRGSKDRKSLFVDSSLNSNSCFYSQLDSDYNVFHLKCNDSSNSRLSKELQTPNSRYSIDLSTHSSMNMELSSPKSRYSLDLNSSRHLSQEFINCPPWLNTDVLSLCSNTPQGKYRNDFNKHSSTFDNIKSLIQEGVIESYKGPLLESTTDCTSSVSPMIRVVSLPSLNAEDHTLRCELTATAEEEESQNLQQNIGEVSSLRKIEQSISELLERRDIEVSSILQNNKCVLRATPFNEKKKTTPSKPVREPKNVERQNFIDLQKSSSRNEIQHSEEYYRQLLIDNGSVQHYSKRNGIQKSESAKEMLIAHREKEARQITSSSLSDFPVRVEILQHDFPPLPPSPVEEDEDEYSEIEDHLSHKPRSKTLPTLDSPVPPLQKELTTSSLKTRSIDAVSSKSKRNNFLSSSSRNIPSERRTLPAELQGIKRKTYQKRSSQNSREEHHMQTSCSLPETPIFARGCDIPRTPHRKAPDIPISHSIPKQSNTMNNLNTIENSASGYRRNSGRGHAIVGAELLRLAGGPGRGWYPKHRHARPLSIEHLDRLTPGHNPWDSSRKPLTLPPNLTPKFFQKSPRDALRRVTSLLIRKGNNGKETRKEITLQKCNEPRSGEETQKKKGFFKNLWKKSRHYSLEQQ